jgi:two-component system chemotaxis response regulator CheY
MNGLIVDPSPIQQRILSNVLRRVGCEEVETATDLEGGVAAMGEETGNRFDVVIVERDLPDGDGLDLIRRFRGTNAEAPGTAVLVTMRNARRDVMEALQAGVDAYVLKPLNPEALLERIATAVVAPHESEAPPEAAAA